MGILWTIEESTIAFHGSTRSILDSTSTSGFHALCVKVKPTRVQEDETVTYKVKPSCIYILVRLIVHRWSYLTVSSYTNILEICWTMIPYIFTGEMTLLSSSSYHRYYTMLRYYNDVMESWAHIDVQESIFISFTDIYMIDIDMYDAQYAVMHCVLHSLYCAM